jgi:DNA ligase (NAD+)
MVNRWMPGTEPEGAPPAPPDKPVDQMTVDELASAVRYHNWRYFSVADPVVSDLAFDRMTRRLEVLAPDHPALRELVGDATATGEKRFHDPPMLSLGKCYDDAELAHWADAFEGELVVTPKIDGVAASLKYGEDGRLMAAVTRGDGLRGEVFTQNALHIEGIPVALGSGTVEIRGEVHLPLSRFARLGGDFSNPRNTAAGAIKQKVAARTAEYGLRFVAYDVLGPPFEAEYDKLTWAAAHGLLPVEARRLPKSELEQGHRHWLERRQSLDLEIDGVVYKADRLSEQARLGATAHHPRYAIAYKFQGDSATSMLRAVEWSVSRTGAITPIAIIDPVELSGAMVSRCSLHNLSIVGKLGVTIGARVVAMRRGGVIPHIEAVTAPGDRPVIPPDRCPSCGSPTEVRRDVLVCTRSANCPEAVRGTLEHFVQAVEIEGFGPKLLGQLLAHSLVSQPADLYRLTPRDLAPMERMGDTLSKKLVASVQAHRSLPLAVVLRALGVAELGASVAETLAAHFRRLDTLLEANQEALAAIHGVGPVMARSIVEGLLERRPFLDRLREHVQVEDWHEVAPPTVPSGHPLAGRSVVFTGKLVRMTRAEAQERVQRLGGRTPDAVTRDLDLLVVGDDGSPLLGAAELSSKHKKALRYQEDGARVRIITEGDFLALASPA